MAKIALIFLAVFCVIQLTLAGRIVREEPKNEEVKTVGDIIQSMTALFEKTFSKDELDKMGNNFKTFSDTLSSRGKELLQQADENIKKLQVKD